MSYSAMINDATSFADDDDAFDDSSDIYNNHNDNDHINKERTWTWVESGEEKQNKKRFIIPKAAKKITLFCQKKILNYI